MFGIGLTELVMLLITLLTVIPLWRVFSRAGLSPALSLLVIVPILGWPIAGLILAFSKWPSVQHSASSGRQ
jgi:hypothetical protein